MSNSQNFVVQCLLDSPDAWSIDGGAAVLLSAAIDALPCFISMCSSSQRQHSIALILSGIGYLESVVHRMKLLTSLWPPLLGGVLTKDISVPELQNALLSEAARGEFRRELLTTLTNSLCDSAEPSVEWLEVSLVVARMCTECLAWKPSPCQVYLMRLLSKICEL